MCLSEGAAVLEGGRVPVVAEAGVSSTGQISPSCLGGGVGDKGPS